MRHYMRVEVENYGKSKIILFGKIHEKFVDRFCQHKLRREIEYICKIVLYV